MIRIDFKPFNAFRELEENYLNLIKHALPVDVNFSLDFDSNYDKFNVMAPYLTLADLISGYRAKLKFVSLKNKYKILVASVCFNCVPDYI